MLRGINSNLVIRYNANELAELCSTPFKDLKNSLLLKSVTRAIDKILKEHKVEKGIGNLLYVDRFILPCIYLLEDVSFRTLHELTIKAIKQDDVLSKIIVRSTLTRLINQRKILRTINGYQVTTVGANHVRSVFERKRLDGLRLEIMNFENRRRSTFNYDNIPYVHP